MKVVTVSNDPKDAEAVPSHLLCTRFTANIQASKGAQKIFLLDRYFLSPLSVTALTDAVVGRECF
jgi:hypothetical protein